MSQRTTNGQTDTDQGLGRSFAFVGLFCLLLALAGHPGPAAAAGAWFVSISGNDANDCSMFSPCRTIGHALEKAIDGDSIYAAAGSYNEHLVIQKSVRIAGADSSTTIIDGMSNGRVIEVTGAVSTTLSSLMVRNGHTTSPDDGGAGIWNRASSRLALDAVRVVSNVVYASSSNNVGGGIRNEGVLTIANSTISQNWAMLGGGIFNATAATLMMSNAVLSNNSAFRTGGLDNLGSASLSQVAVRSNTAVTQGGGIYNDGGSLTITNSTVEGNQAPAFGGIFNAATATLINSTISGNRATDSDGGGIYNFASATITLTNVTLSGNSAEGADGHGGALADMGVIYVRNSIFADSPSGGNCYRTENIGAAIISLGYNLSSDSACASFLNQTGDLNNQDPRLSPLAYLGGPTAVHGLAAGSRAIDAGNPAAPGSGGNACPATDQRGVARPVGARCDIGAFEGTVELAWLPLIGR